MTDHEQLADEREEEADKLERESERIADHVDEARDLAEKRPHQPVASERDPSEEDSEDE